MSGAPNSLKERIDDMSHGAKISMLAIPTGEMQVDWNKVVFNMPATKGIHGR